ncbi:RDD family protein [Nitrosomonas sp.]|uniref:RDD family protein n=1 Tax=Nitrosomonas sp. TaxID=42353 RepID=UPI0025F38854|nr:RDD family protein [Nitrosomonas sp.]MBS0588059.1 RDD family protein [Pseudomonadota bacterium]MBV6447535.1 hypothetical protein [Nitrosomonas sp.]
MTYSTPKFWRRIICLIYDFLLILAVLFIASFIFHFIFSDTQATYFKPLFQFYLFTIMGYYFTWFWTHGGQTLAMQTWKMRLVSADGRGLTKKQAVVRYLFSLTGIFFFVVVNYLFPINFISYQQLALVSVLIFGSGFIWALFDPDHQYLHDRLAGTRIIKLEG